MNHSLQDRDLEKQIERLGYKGEVTPYTALEIIDQMPYGTGIERVNAITWKVTFPITEYYPDFREDSCPHRACALAFIAWKKGLEI